jgi:hypothetical protein
MMSCLSTGTDSVQRRRPSLPALGRSDVDALEPVVDARVLDVWLRQARAGDAFEYHRGLLGVDRGQLADDAARDALEQLAGLAFRLAGEGRVHLAQRRLAPGVFSYLAIARPPATRHHPEARR